MKTIYAVEARTDYEGGDVVRCYSDKRKAEKFRVACEQYHNTRPASPGVLAPDNEHDAWWADLEKWKKKHPAGETNSYCDSFALYPLELH